MALAKSLVETFVLHIFQGETTEGDMMTGQGPLSNMGDDGCSTGKQAHLTVGVLSSDSPPWASVLESLVSSMISSAGGRGQEVVAMDWAT